MQLTITGATATSITVNIAAAAGEGAFELEANRAADFVSDDSMVRTGLAAGAQTIAGLASGTVWYVRARSTSGSVKPWSAPLGIMTVAPAAPVPYAGSSIAPSVVVVPETIMSIDAGYEQLLDPDPNATARKNAAGTISINFVTAGQAIDTVALLGTLLDPTATWRLEVRDDPNGAAVITTAMVPFHLSSGLGWRPSYHGMFRLIDAVTSRYWRLVISASTPQLIARNLVVGKARETQNYVRGSTEEPVDLGTVTRNQYGTPFNIPGWIMRKRAFGMEWMTETEYQTKWATLDLLVGTTRPVLALPNSRANEYLHDRVAFGEITSMSGEHQRGRRYSKKLEITSIY